MSVKVDPKSAITALKHEFGWFLMHAYTFPDSCKLSIYI